MTEGPTAGHAGLQVGYLLDTAAGHVLNARQSQIFTNLSTAISQVFALANSEIAESLDISKQTSTGILSRGLKEAFSSICENL